MNIQYIGEHILVGQLGTMFIWLAFISALLIPVAFFMVDRKPSVAGRKAANSLYLFHFITLLASAFVLYFALANHYFEYSYVWQYSSTDLPFKFIISCFWAGQEGSFMIWAIWQALLGLFLLRINTEWRGKVLTVLAFGQIFFLSMVLGLNIGGIHIGASPFALLRDLPQNIGSDFFANPNYLTLILDGNGLNPLLENIWMVIHPPTLFLGYAALMIPFCFAVASLWKRDYYGWLKPALLWALFGVFILGTGILLGGRWAYESLTFGGFWAWDPVENASLVPWLMLIGALHLMLIAYKRKQSFAMAYVMVFLSFIFVVYATYLTRSGVLGETSVHSFGDDGKSAQMILFMALFTLVPFALLIINRKHLPRKTNEFLWSREFWMLMGSIVLLLSAFQITVTTSIPVINKILGTHIAPPIENVAYYNNWQTPYGILVAFLIAGAQFLVYGTNDRKNFFKNISISAAIALFFTIILALVFHVKRFDHAGLMFFTIFAITDSLDYVFRYIRKIENSGAAITHAGFGIFLLGILLAFSNSQIISRNHSGFDLGKEKDNNENLVLMKGDKQPMGDYMVTYSSNEVRGRETFYKVDFVRNADSASGKVAFSIYPSINHNERMGNVYNPATRHFFNKDIYTYISFAESADTKSTDGYSLSTAKEIKLKDTITFARSFIILDSIIVDMKDKQVENASITAKFRILSMQYGEMKTQMKYIIKNGQLSREDGIIEPLNIKLSFQGVSNKSDAIMLGIYEKKSDYIVLKAIVFPWMNVLWGGFAIMLGGLSIAFLRRITDKKNSVANPQNQ
ncbi:MAG TPA: cytochrome c biogenesis protein CcsA [Bacteroidales bacterium]